MEKKSLNEAIIEEAEIPNLKTTFEDSRTHIDMPYGLGSAYIESEKKRKEIEDRFKDKEKEIEEYKKMYASEESKTRIKPEVNKKMYLSESLFEDSNLKFVSNRYSPDDPGFDEYDEVKEDEVKEKVVVYQFPHLLADDRSVARREYSLKVLNSALGDTLVKGKKKDIEAFADEYLGYELNPDYFVENPLAEDTKKTKSGKWVNKGDTGETHGEFKTKKAADEQRKAIFASGWKKESLKEADEGYPRKSRGLKEAKEISKDELSRKIGGAVYDAYIREFKKATGIDVEDMVSDEDPLWSKLANAVESLNKTLYDFYYKSQKKSKNESLTEFTTIAKLDNKLEVVKYPYGFAISDGYVNDKIYVRDNKDFALEDGRFKLSDKDKEKIKELIKKGVINESLTEAKVRPEDDVDFDEFDMFAFISNLFVKDMKPDLLPLKSIGGFDSQGKELTATEDSIILGTNNEEDFDEVKKICDEYDFGHRDTKVPNGKSKFYHEIDVPTYDNGYPMDVAEYFEEVEIPLEEVMPEKYIRKLKASRKNTASAFDKKKK